MKNEDFMMWLYPGLIIFGILVYDIITSGIIFMVYFLAICILFVSMILWIKYWQEKKWKDIKTSKY